MTWVVDSLGRTIELREPGRAERRRLHRIAGSRVHSIPYMFAGHLLMSVATLGGQVVKVRTEHDLERLAGEVGDAGLAAILSGWQSAGWISEIVEANASPSAIGGQE